MYAYSLQSTNFNQPHTVLSNHILCTSIQNETYLSITNPFKICRTYYTIHLFDITCGNDSPLPKQKNTITPDITSQNDRLSLVFANINNEMTVGDQTVSQSDNVFAVLTLRCFKMF